MWACVRATAYAYACAASESAGTDAAVLDGNPPSALHLRLPSATGVGEDQAASAVPDSKPTSISLVSKGRPGVLTHTPTHTQTPNTCAHLYIYRDSHIL